MASSKAVMEPGARSFFARFADDDVWTVNAWSVAMLRLLLESRLPGILLGVVSAIYLALLHFGVVIYRCPLQTNTGLFCAGCGLSTALLAMFRGQFAVMWIQHPFAPYFVLLGAVVFLAGVLPEIPRKIWILFVLRMEYRTRLHAVVLISFAAFGAVRLFISCVGSASIWIGIML
ncbi:MAG: DUF2752 domain-containing protein [Kiritimatiellia bacterium]